MSGKSQHLLQSDDLTRNRLCNSQSDDIANGTHVCNESSRFVGRKAVRLRTQRGATKSKTGQERTSLT